MPTYGGTPVLTIGKADAARRTVEKWLDNYGSQDRGRLYKPGHEGPYWCYSLEGADEWTIAITQDPSVQWPDGVFAEPVTTWCLGLYPA